MLRAMLALRAPAARFARAPPAARRRCLLSARAASTSAAVDAGPPPHVALVTFERSPGQRPELGLVENGHWLWTLDVRRPLPPLEDQDPNTKEYWLQVQRDMKRQRNRLMKIYNKK